jgi:hypothetical protein
MQTHCNAADLSFQGFNGKKVHASFDGGHITSDPGGLLLREVELGLEEFFARTFLRTTKRAPRLLILDF